MFNRPRRLRRSPVIREMLQETHLHKSDLIYPLFVVEGSQIKEPVAAMPDVYRFSVDMLGDELEELRALGIVSVLLFGIPNHKDAQGSGAYAADGVIQRAVAEAKRLWPELYIITDVCMCEYTDHGHCGILRADGSVDNDETLPYLSRIAVSHARAGADMVAPSDMMDGRVAAIRTALDAEGFSDVPIMAYSAKFASCFYGPFREAACSTPAFGNRRSYQLDCHNGDEALREIALDIEEGADIVMVKPALAYLDVLARAKAQFNIPFAAYNVSGEYAMLRNAVTQGLLAEDAIWESVTAIKRAGAKLIITYFAKYLCKGWDSHEST